MTVRFVDPRAPRAADGEEYDLGLGDRLDQPGIRLAMLANGYPDSDSFCAVLGDAFQAVVPGAIVSQYMKANGSRSVEPELLDRIMDENDAVLTAVGSCGSCTMGTVNDAISAARRGAPALALVTDRFWPHAHYVADAAGFSSIPLIQVPHPIGGLAVERMREVASQVVPTIVGTLRGSVVRQSISI